MKRDLDAIYDHYQNWCHKLRLRPASRDKYLHITRTKVADAAPEGTVRLHATQHLVFSPSYHH